MKFLVFQHIAVEHPGVFRELMRKDGITWDKGNEFVVREGGVPGATVTETPGSSRMTPASGKIKAGGIDWNNPGIYQHIGYPSVVQMPDSTVVVAYHEWDESEKPLQDVRCTRFKL